MTDQTPAAPTPSSEPLTLRGAAFDTFRKRARRGVLVFATIAFIFLLIVIYGIFGFLNWQGVLAYAQWYGDLFQNMANARGDPQAMQATMMPPQAVMNLMPALYLMLFFVYATLAAYEAACLKWLVRGETGGVFLGLGFGAETWLVYFGYWLWFFFYMAAIIALEIGVVLIVVVAGIASAASGAAQNGFNLAAMGVGGLIALLFLVVGLCAWIWVSVRFAPAAALSVARRRFAFFDAWTVTRGRFWSLLGSFLLLLLLYFVALIVLGGVGFVVALSGPIGALATVGGQPDPQAVFDALAQPQTLIALGAVYFVLLIVGFTFFVAMFGVNARAVLVAEQEGRV